MPGSQHFAAGGKSCACALASQVRAPVSFRAAERAEETHEPFHSDALQTLDVVWDGQTTLKHHTEP